MRRALGTLLLTAVACSGGAQDPTANPTTGIDGTPSGTLPGNGVAGGDAPPSASSTPTPSATDPAATADLDPAFGRPALRRLTVLEYTNTVTSLFGEPLAQGLDLEPDTQLNGLSAIGAADLALSAIGTEKFEAAAYQVADRLIADVATREGQVGCDPAAVGCIEQFVTDLGRSAWRRPLSSVEVERYAGLSALAVERTGDVWQGVRYALAGLLQSPNFIYRAEIGEPDPAAPSRRVLSEFELASRIAYLLQSAPPDETLLQAAESGQLQATLASHVARMLDSATAPGAAADFFSEYLQLYRLADTVKDTDAFPAFDDALSQAMLEQTRQTMAQLAFVDQLDFRSLFTTKQTFLNDELAALYGVELEPGTGFRPYLFGADEPYAGVLTQASFLSINGHVSTTSPTLRGRFVREVLLCQGIPAPPPGVDITLPEFSDEVRTARERLEVHTTNASCAVCHSLMDPIGLGLENFDSIGAYRETENGVVIDATGVISDPTGQVGELAFNGAEGLGQALASHPGISACLVQTLFRHASASLASTAETGVITSLTSDFSTSGYNFRNLLASMATNPAFGYVRALD